LLKFTQDKEKPKDWVLSNGDEQVEINLNPSTVTNKFFIVTNFIERVSEFHGEEFSDWYIKLIKTCIDEQKREVIILENVDVIKDYVNKYLDSLEINYHKFVDETKIKKNSILFTAEDIDKIIRLSCYLKLYAPISNNKNFAPGKKLHKTIYNKFASNILKTDVVTKIFDVVKTKTFRYKLTDKFMWEYIKTIQCKDIGIHIIEIFNFIMNNIIILCEENKNPITYFVGVVDESVKWFLRSVYKGSIVYDDEISTEDIHGIHINNLLTYTYNDTLGRLKTIAYQKIQLQIEREKTSMMEEDLRDQYLVDFHNRLPTIKYISPLCECLVFPILSRITGISYVHFKTVSGEHAAVLSYYLNMLLTDVFQSDYSTLFSLLDYYPTPDAKDPPSIATTYKVKATSEYVNTAGKYKNFFGFNTMIFLHKSLCHFVGRVSRVKFIHLATARDLPGIPLGKVERDMIHFYTRYFAGKLDKKIDEVTERMNSDF